MRSVNNDRHCVRDEIGLSRWQGALFVARVSSYCHHVLLATSKFEQVKANAAGNGPPCVAGSPLRSVHSSPGQNVFSVVYHVVYACFALVHCL